MELALNALMTGILFLPVTSLVAGACVELLDVRNAEDPNVVLALLRRSASRGNPILRSERRRFRRFGIAA